MVRLSAPNSLLLITTSRHAEVPDQFLLGALTAATKNCIAVGTIAEYDGEVDVLLVGDDWVDVDGTLSLEADTTLDSSEGFLAIETVDGAIVVSQQVYAPHVRVRIWASSSDEPDRLLVQVATL